MKDGDKLLYLKVPLEILSMSKVLNDTTGEVVVLDLYDKIVYCYLHNWYKLGGSSRFTPKGEVKDAHFPKFCHQKRLFECQQLVRPVKT